MIICIGETVIDYIGDRSFIGGSILNTAKAAARQGASVSYLSEISQDENGLAVLNDLIDNCVMFEPSMCSSPFSTMTARAIQTENGVKYQFAKENSTAINISADKLINAFAVNSDIDCVCLGSISFADPTCRAEILKAVDTLRNVTIYFDANCRPSLIEDKEEYIEAVKSFAKKADIFKCSDEDLDYMGFKEDNLLELCKDSLVVTYGKKGAKWFVKGRTPICQKAFAPKIFKDTVGCGDVFNGTVLANIEKDKNYKANIKNILKKACLAGALNCEQEGCCPPTAQQLASATNLTNI